MASEEMPNDLESFEQLRDEVEEEIAELRDELNEAKAEYHATGVKADPLWMVETQTLLRRKGRIHQKAIRAIAQIRKESSRSLADYFVEVVSEEVAEIDFKEMMDIARQRLEVDRKKN